MTLTAAALDRLPPGLVFARGEAVDAPGSLNMTGSGKPLRWVAVTGSVGDWAMYCHWADRSWEWIVRHGDKVGFPEHVRRFVAADDQALERYRL